MGNIKVLFFDNKNFKYSWMSLKHILVTMYVKWLVDLSNGGVNYLKLE